MTLSRIVVMRREVPRCDGELGVDEEVDGALLVETDEEGEKEKS